MKPFFILLLLLLFSFKTDAQPGQMYFPPAEYYYTILNEYDNVIIFAGNQNYKIAIDSVWYHPDSIPTYPASKRSNKELQDSLNFTGIELDFIPLTTYGGPNPNHYIHVNDFYLNLSQAPSTIKVVHKNDTMVLFQQSSSAKTLKFTSGIHYFPNWANHALKGLPELVGSKYLNIDQNHFIISKSDYVSLQKDAGQRLNEQRIDKDIATRFVKYFMEVKYDFTPLKFMQDASPYDGGHLESQLYPTKDENVYMAMVEYRMHQNNCTSYKDFFTRIDLNKKKIEHWFPMENPQEFGSSTRFFKVDTFNRVVYLRMFYRTDTIRPIKECASWATYKNVMYKSFNEGKDWQVDAKYTKLFDEHEFYKYEFLDEHYAVGYKFQKITHKNKKHQIDQGVYYLLKDGKIVETFLTPEDVHFNNNYANYHFNKGLGDTAFLGSWGYNQYNYKASEPYHIYAVKKNSQWKFEVGSNGFKRSQFYREKEVKTEFQNFKIIGDTLFFKNGSKMVIHEKIIENSLANGLFVLEQGSHIYLVNTNNEHMYISFDGGATWFFNPRPITGIENMMLLKIDANYMITFFNRKEFAEETYEFHPR